MYSTGSTSFNKPVMVLWRGQEMNYFIFGGLLGLMWEPFN